MRPTAQIYEVATVRFLEVNERFYQGELTCEQAAEIMGVSVSTFFRKRQRFDEEGEEGLWLIAELGKYPLVGFLLVRLCGLSRFLRPGILISPSSIFRKSL